MTGDPTMPQPPDLKIVPMPLRTEDKETAEAEATVAALRAGYDAFTAGFAPEPGTLVMLNACAAHLSLPVGTPMIVMEKIATPVVIDDKSWVLNAYFGSRFDVRCGIRIQDGSVVILPVDSRMLEPYRPGKAKAPDQPPPVNIPPVGA